MRRFGCPIAIESVRINYFKNIVGQGHRTIKKRVRPMLGFNSFCAGSAPLERPDSAPLSNSRALAA